jgi:hypothetical protein
MLTFFSHGKLLLTAEYAVLDGAQALAIPTKAGQSLSVEFTDKPLLEWQSYDADGTLWFDTKLPWPDVLQDEIAHDSDISRMLVVLLREAFKLHQGNYHSYKGFRVETRLTFPRNWGFGTSSTLVANISEWLDINPYQLLAKTFGGSGYDIACAKSISPIFFSLSGNEPRVHPTTFVIPEMQHASLIYLNQKQNSREAIKKFREQRAFSLTEIEQINAISLELTLNPTADLFVELLHLHEDLMANVLGKERIQDRLFSDFPGVVKSLGAWGGDFVLAYSNQINHQTYFKAKGFQTILQLEETLLF